MNIKRAVISCLFAASAALSASAVTLKVDQVQQRYPWNGLVDIDYTLSFNEGETLGIDDNLEVLMVNHDVSPAVTNRAVCFLQVPLPMTAGAHRITWDANYDGVTNYTDNAEFIVKIVHYAPAYMVIDVSEGTREDAVYRVDFLNGAPVGGFNTDEYKGNKIVLRRIHQGSYLAGTPTNEKGYAAKTEMQHKVSLSRPFYIGLFEITQQQYSQVKGSNPSLNKSGEKGTFRPVENVSWNDVRGGNWPDQTNAAPAKDSFMDMLIQKCKAKDENGNYSVPVAGFDLPTEFQWEFACRAGTTKAFNGSDDFDNTDATAQEKELARLGRYVNNQSEGKGGISSKHTVVGSYDPNAWGLYDMHGNVYEFCRDGWQQDVEVLGQLVDPIGPEVPAGTTTANRVLRGGAHNRAYTVCRSGARSADLAISKGESYGFRLSLTQP